MLNYTIFLGGKPKLKHLNRYIKIGFREKEFHVNSGKLQKNASKSSPEFSGVFFEKCSHAMGPLAHASSVKKWATTFFMRKG